MPNVKQFIRELTAYALARDGVEKGTSISAFDLSTHPSVRIALPFLFRGQFFDVENTAEGLVAIVPCDKKRLKQLQKQHPAIRTAEPGHDDKQTRIAVPLRADLPLEFFQTLIDEGYELLCSQLSAGDRLRMEFFGKSFDEQAMLKRLIDEYDLAGKQQAIQKLARQALLLRTKKISEAKAPLGATKLGGKPDLPADTPWPLYRDGKPLAFLAQFDLAEIAQAGSPIKGLPTDGLISLFSVWGWMQPGDGDPHTPEDGTRRTQEEHGWSVVLHTPAMATLERRKTPRAVNAFKPAAVELTPMLSLPNDKNEPPLATLGWTEAEYRKFDSMQARFRAMQMDHWLGKHDSLASHHKLGGYAVFQQYFPAELSEKGLAMLLQIGSDKNADMGWGDDGNLTFYADAKALAKGRFARIWCDCQGG